MFVSVEVSCAVLNFLIATDLILFFFPSTFSAAFVQVVRGVKEFGVLLGWFMKMRNLMPGTPTMMKLLRYEI